MPGSKCGLEKGNGKAMKSEGPRKDLNASSAAGFWKLLDPSLQLPKANRKSGNSEADIRRRAALWMWKYKRIKPQNESSAGFGQSSACRWLAVLEICQVWLCDEGVTDDDDDLQRNPGPIQMALMLSGHNLNLSSTSQLHPCHCTRLGLQQEIGFIGHCLEDKRDNEC